MPGERGPAGLPGPKGIQGKSGEVGVTYIRWGKKTCPNSEWSMKVTLNRTNRTIKTEPYIA